MKLNLRIWKFTLTVHLLDLDARDKDLSVGISLSWK